MKTDDYWLKALKIFRFLHLLIVLSFIRIRIPPLPSTSLSRHATLLISSLRQTRARSSQGHRIDDRIHQTENVIIALFRLFGYIKSIFQNTHTCIFTNKLHGSIRCRCTQWIFIDSLCMRHSRAPMCYSIEKISKTKSVNVCSECNTHI